MTDVLLYSYLLSCDYQLAIERYTVPPSQKRAPRASLLELVCKSPLI